MPHPTIPRWLADLAQKPALRRLAGVLTHPAAYLFYIALLAYGLLLPAMGLYGDDWEFLYGYYRSGLAGFDQVVGWMRPYSVLVYRALAPLLGMNILAYHIYTLLARWFTGVLVWKLLRLLFPAQPQPALWAAGLFLIYPAFYQQELPLSFSLHFTVQVMFLGSLLLMLHSLEAAGRRRILLTAGGVLLAFSVFIIEYFAGLELIRPALLWLALREAAPKIRLRRTFTAWLPYLGVLAVYLAWRIFFFQSGYQDPILLNELQANPTLTFSQLAVRMANTLVGVIFKAWGSVFQLTQGKSGWLHLALVGLSLLLALLYFRYASRPKDSAQPPESGAPFLWLGLWAALVSGLPLWSSALEYSPGFPGDRLSLPFLLGCSLLWVGLIFIIVRRRYQAPAAALMIALSIGAQFLNANTFRRKAEELRQYFWQLTWRMPGLQPGTFLLSQDMPLGFYSDNNLTPLLLWTYAPDDHSASDAYQYLDVEIREGNVLPYLAQVDLGADTAVDHLAFHSTLGQAVVVFSTPSSCVRVLTVNDPLANVPRELARAAVWSNLGQIIPNPASPAAPPALLGAEPAHGWCYYYAKAELNRQQQDWQAIAALGDQAFGQGMQASSPAELFPFIYGYALSHRLERAWELSQRPSADEKYLPSLCRAWAAIEQELTEPGEEATAGGYSDRLNCPAILNNPCTVCPLP